MKLGVILVHGIGTESPGWAADIIPAIQDATVAALRTVLGDKTSFSVNELLVVESVYWADILNENQRKLFARLQEAHEPLTLKGSWWQRLRQVATRLFRTAERRFVTQSIADITGYLQDEARHLIQQRLLKTIDHVSAEVGGAPEKIPLTVVAHSLGTVVSSDCVYDQTKRRRQRQQEGFHERARLENFFTLGSPLALFSLRAGGAEAFNQPIRMEGRRGRWVNLYDRDDPIGMPLKSLNKAYGEAVLKDLLVESGGYLVAHTRYFRFGRTLAIIGRKLALDWAALNDRLPRARLDSLYAEYDQTLGLG